jgi:hypothetical protein
MNIASLIVENPLAVPFLAAFGIITLLCSRGPTATSPSGTFQLDARPLDLLHFVF